MSKTATATVEVLTAEVRVLMVGSRQITLSVSRQLDTVHWKRCKPFGRIRDSNDHNEKTIIGQHTETGTLVRAHLGSRPRWFEHDEDQLKRWHREISDNTEKINSYTKWAEKPDLHDHYSRYVKDAELKIESLKSRIAEHQGIKDTIPELQKLYDADLATFNALPLIVLAGLR